MQFLINYIFLNNYFGDEILYLSVSFDKQCTSLVFIALNIQTTEYRNIELPTKIVIFQIPNINNTF